MDRALSGCRVHHRGLQQFLSAPAMLPELRGSGHPPTRSVRLAQVTTDWEMPREIEASLPQVELDKRAQEMNSEIKQTHEEAKAGQDYNAQSVSYTKLMDEYFDCLQVSHCSTNLD